MATTTTTGAAERSPVTAATALLLALSAGENYGSQLRERVAIATGGVVLLPLGWLYGALADMADAGLVRVVHGQQRDAGCGGRPRVYYSLTEAGRAEAARVAGALEALVALAAAAPGGG